MGMEEIMSVAIQIDKVSKRYGDAVIIPGLSAAIHNGEFFTLLGPSGCGKTTLLRMLAGFESIEGGEIRFDDRVMNGLPPHQRNIGMVFQSYAIFPHLTVRQNVEYGLKLRKLSRQERRKRVDEILEAVQISEYQDRLPEQLSGGQQQRVALARAIVIHPSVLLMDEPLSNLDAKLRVEMRSVIREVQKQVGITTIYVTHDQEEALSISDRIAVLQQGQIQQTASPWDIYARPDNRFVASFVGQSNLFRGRVQRGAAGPSIVFADGWTVPLPGLSDEAVDGMEIMAAVRPEEFSPQPRGMRCRVRRRIFLGRYSSYQLEFPPEMLVPGQDAIEFSQNLGQAGGLLEPGMPVTLQPDPARINVFTADGARSLLRDVVQHG